MAREGDGRRGAKLVLRQNTTVRSVALLYREPVRIAF
jgi:hypothetical protein